MQSREFLSKCMYLGISLVLGFLRSQNYAQKVLKEELVKGEKDTQLSLHNAALIQITCPSST